MDIDVEAHARRREALLEAIGPGVVLLAAPPTAIRNQDVEHSYRQDSDLFYLSGFDEPASVLLLTNRHEAHRAVLFVRPRDPEREVWDGPRAGVEGAVERFGVDAAYPIAELAERLPDYLQDVDRLHYRLGRDATFDRRVFEAIDVVRGRARKGVRPPSEIVDPGVRIHEMRLHKHPEELARMRRAIEITAEAHDRAMEVARPGRYEFEVEAEIARTFLSRGSRRPAYESIVGSGPNATILHYVLNRRQMESGDLLLIDAGCEYDYYASDVTRTFPVSGSFGPEQRAVYEVVLAAQVAAIEAVRPEVTIDDVHQVALGILVDGLLDLRLLTGTRDEVIERESYKPFYMHRTSHWLGMDVHDVGAHFIEGKRRPLEPSMVLTIEPGLYIGRDADVEERFRGIGIRIEDDVLVTVEGRENLTAAIPKTVEALEERLARRA